MKKPNATKDKPDWEFIDGLTDDEIATMAADPDVAPIVDDAWFDRATHRVGDKIVRRGRRPLGDAPKRQVTLRLDQDVIDHFRATGDGWQSRINAVLREAIKATS